MFERLTLHIGMCYLPTMQ